MDRRFPLWLQLRLGSWADIKKRVRQVEGLFATGRVTPETFSDEFALRAAMTDLVHQESFELGLDSDPSDEEGEDVEGVPCIAEVPAASTRSAMTVVHDLEALGYYAEFLGVRGTVVREYLGGMSLDAKHIQQSAITVAIQDPTESIQLVARVIELLRARQVRTSRGGRVGVCRPKAEICSCTWRS